MRSASGVDPPAAAIASMTRAPARSRTTPLRTTAPTTSTISAGAARVVVVTANVSVGPLVGVARGNADDDGGAGAQPGDAGRERDTGEQRGRDATIAPPLVPPRRPRGARVVHQWTRNFLLHEDLRARDRPTEEVREKRPHATAPVRHRKETDVRAGRAGAGSDSRLNHAPQGN